MTDIEALANESERLHEALRAWALGDKGVMAAVEVLIEEQWWLRRLLHKGLIDYTEDPDLIGLDSPPLASIDWVKTEQQPWNQSGGERALLQAICSIGSGQVQVNLRDIFLSMDTYNSGLVLKALTRF
ncbi:hypothetical protein [Streptomyces sp. NPDC088752]|uniref:hypothetical protein n=1 Tax=Streptomyces sp. NPDC088752 TaxID=3154963 RepID=UPI00342787B5